MANLTEAEKNVKCFRVWSLTLSEKLSLRSLKVQGLKSRMSYLARFVMLTLLLDELQRKESYST